MTTPDFPEGFQGAGPVFAAVPDMSGQWYRLAASGASTYAVENPRLDADGHVTGPAFLARADAEAVADASGVGELWHWYGTTGWHEPTAARAEAERQAELEEVRLWAWPDDPWWRGPASDPSHPQHEDAMAAAREAEIEAADEWDCADSVAYQDRIDAGLEPEAE